MLDSALRGVGLRPGWVNVLCFWEKHFPLTVSLSTQEYKWVPANFQGSLMNAGEGGSDTPHQLMLGKPG